MFSLKSYKITNNRIFIQTKRCRSLFDSEQLGYSLKISNNCSAVSIQISRINLHLYFSCKNVFYYNICLLEDMVMILAKTRLCYIGYLAMSG